MYEKLQAYLEKKGLKVKVESNKTDKEKLITDINKATTVAQLKTEMVKLVQLLNK